MHASAQIEGRTSNPYSTKLPVDKSVAVGIIVLFYLIACTIAFIYFFIEKRKIDKMSSNRNPDMSTAPMAPPNLNEVKEIVSTKKRSTSVSGTKKKRGYGI